MCHFIPGHLCRMHVCLAVTWHLHFGQPNDWDVLRVTAVTRGWNGYRNKSQHRKLTPERKILPPLLRQRCKPTTFRLWVRRANHWAIPTPHMGENCLWAFAVNLACLTLMHYFICPYLHERDLCLNQMTCTVEWTLRLTFNRFRLSIFTWTWPLFKPNDLHGWVDTKTN